MMFIRISLVRSILPVRTQTHLSENSEHYREARSERYYIRVTAYRCCLETFFVGLYMCVIFFSYFQPSEDRDKEK